MFKGADHQINLDSSDDSKLADRRHPTHRITSYYYNNDIFVLHTVIIIYYGNNTLTVINS